MLNHRAATLVLCTVLLTGCNRGPSLNAVKGKVTIKGNGPVTKGTITFVNKQNTGYGTIQGNGEYSMSSKTAGEGLLPGDYKVSVSGTTLGDPHGSEPVKKVIDSKYEDSETSGLTCTVKAGANTFDFELDPATAEAPAAAAPPPAP